ncbi:hypothetical protein K1719_031953 [Acacia pycnantha]|nr:hypothetical protein K1719_031953 [Acacia pycnantha]
MGSQVLHLGFAFFDAFFQTGSLQFESWLSVIVYLLVRLKNNKWEHCIGRKRGNPIGDLPKCEETLAEDPRWPRTPRVARVLHFCGGHGHRALFCRQEGITQIQSPCVEMDRLWQSIAAKSQRDLWKRYLKQKKKKKLY